MEIQIRDNKGNSFRNPLRKRLIQQNPCFAFYQFDTGSGPPNWSSIAERSMSIGTPKLSALVPCQIPSFSTKMEEGYLGTTLNLSGNCIYKSFPVTSNLWLPAIFWMWNNLFMGLWILQTPAFWNLDRPVTTCNLFFQGTRCKTWETYTAERFTKPCAGGGWDLHTWNSSGFHSFIVEMQKQNVSWDKTDITTYSKYPHFRWVSTAFF